MSDMEVKIWSLSGANWHIKGKERYLVLEHYPVYKLDEPLPKPFIPIADVYRDEVMLDFFAGHILPFHYLRLWGKRAGSYFIKQLKEALKYDIANVEGYSLGNIVFSEGKVYILPPRRKGFTLHKVISDLERYLEYYAQEEGGYPYTDTPVDPPIVIRRGIYHLEKPFSMAEIFGLMRRLVIWGYYPVLSVSPSQFMEGSRFMRSLAFYMPWHGKTSTYDMIPSMALIMRSETRISVGMGSIVSRILDSLGADKVAFITLGMPKVFELYPLVGERDIVIYTDEDADVSISLGGKWKESTETLESAISCLSYTMWAYNGIDSWEDTKLLADIRCRANNHIDKEKFVSLKASDLFNIWRSTGDKRALGMAIWKDRHKHELVSMEMYHAMVKSSLIERKGFYQYLVYGAVKNGLVDIFPLLLKWERDRGLLRIYTILIRMYLGDLPDGEEIERVVKELPGYPLGRLLWSILMFVNYISRTKWDSKYEDIHKPVMDFMYISPPSGLDKWLFLTAKNAFAISYMHSGNLNEAYNILSSIINDAKRYGYFDILFKVYNNLSILSGEISPRLASEYLLFAATYALVSGGTSLGGVFASLLTEEVQRAPMKVLRRIYEVGWSIPLDDVQEFVLLATWIWVLISRGNIREALRNMRVLEKKYSFPTGDIVKDIEYYYLKLLLFMVKGEVGDQTLVIQNLLNLLENMPLTNYRPDIYKKIALYFYTAHDKKMLGWIRNEIAYRYGEDSISYLFASALNMAVSGNIHGAIDIMKDVYRKNLHVWKLLDASEAAFLIGDMYCKLSKGKIASVYYRKAEVLLTRLEAMNLLRYMLARHEVCVNIDVTSDFYGRMKMFTGNARKLMEEMYSLILDLESENFFLDRIMDMFSMITDVASLDVILGRMLVEILHILPAEKGYIATVGGDLQVWVSYSLEGKSPSVDEFAFSPEDVVKRGGIFLKSPSAIGDVELIGREHLVVFLENDTAPGVFSDMDEYFLIKLMEIIRVAVLMESLGNVSVKDKLTELYARWYGIKRGMEEFEKAKRGIYPVSVLYMDLDGFKEINDTYGHSIGDKVLSHVGNIIRESVRYMDIPFRYGGDEFIVVLPATGKSEAVQVAKRIVDAIFRFFEKYPYKVSISIGVSSYPSDEVESFEHLMKLADSRLYKAKALGKNRYYEGGNAE